jgi:ubiquinone/menaquinone biosynthesis C-methylase UbiE
VTVSQKWDKRVGQWHDHVNSATAFGKVLDRILVLSRPQPSDVCVDLGAGTGFVTTALAPLVASVRAVDISPAMTEACGRCGAREHIDRGNQPEGFPAPTSSSAATRYTTWPMPTSGR